MTESYAYEMGWQCALHGANATNCHFAIFSRPEFTQAWQRGRDAGIAERYGITREARQQAASSGPNNAAKET